ncbi:GDSL-type esterase/lipase family protein [Ruminococcus albus]|uniref:Lysophospholipase L1 n=1 Tax=Ruminococcus albus TaxID=1264 RepID=A0A1I1L681_RUMAL|nr:GDSL-type esterase/lipase family protein [Ruminococcus albus]SFC68567.1 Lysophospholipase L1 [Ruminococcus albus]
MKSKRILAGMLALLLASGTAPVNFGSALTTDAAIAWGIEPDAENPEAGSSNEDKGDGISEDTISSDDETEAVTADEDNTDPDSVNDYEKNGSSDENVAETTDQETTDQETADDETTADETSDAETTDEETTAEETTDDIFIIISPDTAIPLGAYVIINSDDHFFDGKTVLRIGNVITADKAKLSYDSYDLQYGYKFMFKAPNSADTFTIGIANEDGSLTPLGIRCVSGSGTLNDPYKFETVFKKAENKKKSAGGFITVTSIKEAVEKMTDVSPEDARAWLAANVDAIKAADNDHHGTFDLFFKYKNNYYCKTLTYQNLNAEYIEDPHFKWDSITEEGRSAIMYQCLGQKEHILVWGNAEEQIVVTYTKTEAKEPTCTNAGNSEYYTGSDNKYYKLENGVYTEISKNSWVIAPKGHNYGTPQWTWNDDLTAKAEFICEDCGDVIVIDADVTSKIIAEATYTTEGKITYTAKVVFEDNYHTCSKSVSIPKLELVYVEAKTATCTEDGNTGYWYDKANDKYFTDDKGKNEIAKADTVIKSNGHSYGLPQWTWSDDNTASAEFVCEKCGDTLVIKAEVTSKIVEEPTYTKAGKITYTAKIVFGNNHHTCSRSVTIPKLGLSYVEAIAATCTEGGNIEYWYDEANDKYFADENGENEITKADTIVEAKGHTRGDKVIENYVKPTFLSDGGYDEVYYCIDCGIELSREHIALSKLKYKAPALTYTKGINAVKLSWSEVEDAERYGIVGYVNGKWQLLYDCEDTSFVLNGLTEGRDYWVAVIPKCNGKWITDFSNAIVVSAQSTVGKYPILSSVEHNEETHQFRLRWSEVKGAQQYGVAVYLSGKWKIVKQDIPAETTYFTSPKLTAGQTYRMVVCAKVNGKWDTSNINARSFSVTVQPEAVVNHGNYEADDFVFSGNVYIVGDSTVCNYKPETTESKGSCGWGMKLGEQFEGVNVTNLARAGRSSRSFMNDPEYKILCDSIGKGDYLFIQFGHNDERTAEPQHAAYPYLEFSTLDGEGKNPNGQYSYEWMLLNKYVRVAQEKGATAVLVTPVSRRAKDGTAMIEEHKQYSDAVVALGKKYNIPVIDMTTKTAELYNKLYEEGGEEATAELHCYLDETRTTIDNTHLSIKGCELIADILAEETRTLGLKISEKLK